MSAVRNILSLDGGGIRGLFTLEILAKIEAELRRHHGKSDLVLADHFHLIAGTSTGAIIAALLSWGESVESVITLYTTRAREMFRRSSIFGILDAKYRSEGIANVLREFFIEDDGRPALLGTCRLRTLLLVIMRNASRGSAWPITNNPAAKYNLRVNPDGSPAAACNLNIPLWQLVRASTAAPWFFPPELVQVGAEQFSFVDGGVTPYNNPALIALLTATLPAYNVNWPVGTSRLTVVSVGTGATRAHISPRLHLFLRRINAVSDVPKGLLSDISDHQDTLCRILGECVFGDALDSEIGDLRPSGLLAPEEKKFRYVRYNRRFTAGDLAGLEKRIGAFNMDNLKLMDFLQESGREYAEANVQLAHLVS